LDLLSAGFSDVDFSLLELSEDVFSAAGLSADFSSELLERMPEGER
jgi:hypothetical protein